MTGLAPGQVLCTQKAGWDAPSWMVSYARSGVFQMRIDRAYPHRDPAQSRTERLVLSMDGTSVFTSSETVYGSGRRIPSCYMLLDELPRTRAELRRSARRLDEVCESIGMGFCEALQEVYRRHNIRN